MLFLLVCACFEEPPVAPPAPTQAEAEAKAQETQKAAPKPERPPAEGPPLRVNLVFHDISVLHQSFFATAEPLNVLMDELRGTVTDPADIQVGYSAQELRGWVRLTLNPGILRVPVVVDGDTVDLQALEAITRPLAKWQGAVAARTDMRIANFEVGIESIRGTERCLFGVAGDHPRDGALVSPCVQLGAKKACGTAGPKGVLFSPEDARVIRSCLDR